ncbi:MAG: septation protein SepH, partial [Jatrophihabitans sp.]
NHAACTPRDQPVNTYRRAMRQLRFAGPAEDAGHFVLESVDGLDRFRLINDDALRTAVAAATAFPARAQTQAPTQVPTSPPAVRDNAEVGPREIQVRVRAGESPQELADSLGVPLERVMRFAGPVVDERLRIVDEARRARARRTGREGTENAAVVFGEAVDDRFAAHGVTPTDVSWDSRRREDGDWILEATWGVDSTHSASWAFSRSSRFVNALDDTAADLLSDRPIRPIVAPLPEPERASLAAAPPLAYGVVAFPPMPDAHTGPLPRYREVFDQESREDAPRELPDLIPVAAELDYEAPPLPLGITDPTTRPNAVPTLTNINRAKRGQSDEDRAARAHVPSWDDILLGVRRKE